VIHGIFTKGPIGSATDYKTVLNKSKRSKIIEKPGRTATSHFFIMPHLVPNWK